MGSFSFVTPTKQAIPSSTNVVLCTTPTASLCTLRSLWCTFSSSSSSRITSIRPCYDQCEVPYPSYSTYPRRPTTSNSPYHASSYKYKLDSKQPDHVNVLKCHQEALCALPPPLRYELKSDINKAIKTTTSGSTHTPIVSRKSSIPF